MGAERSWDERPRFWRRGSISARGRAGGAGDCGAAPSTPRGVSVAAADMHFPNGSVIAPDGKTLIVGETLGGVLTAFDIGAGGALANRRVWASTSPRVPDGIALDAKGRIWIANPIAPECALIAEGGEVV